jgi:hypothetical protein
MNSITGELGTVGVRHAFDLLGMWTSHSAASHVQLVTENETIRRLIYNRLAVPSTSGMVDISLYPFSLEQMDPVFEAPIVAGCFRNIFSYRKLIRFSMPAYSISRLRSVLSRQGYRLEKLIGIYPPRFVFWWSLSVLAATRLPSLHFQWEQLAMNYLATSRQAATTFSHIVVFYACQLDS